jgi:hypothetical protein
MQLSLFKHGASCDSQLLTMQTQLPKLSKARALTACSPWF